jgi:hypothetical protein
MDDCIVGLRQDGATRFFTIFEEARSKAWLQTVRNLQQDILFYFAGVGH